MHDEALGMASGSVSPLVASSDPWPITVAVIGAAGLIGSGVVAGLAVAGLCQEIRMLDLRQNLVEAHAIDIRESQALTGSTHTRLVTTAGDGPVDLVVVAASAPETPGGDRRDFLRANLQLLDKLTPQIQALTGTEGTVMLLSNPVDILAEHLRRTTSIRPERIVGYSLNDSVRFRLAISRELGLSVDRVQALVLGEHGAAQVPVFSGITVDGIVQHLDADQRQRVRADVNGWFQRWSDLKPGRSSGWTTPLGTVEVVRAMGASTPIPATVWTGEIPELQDSYVTVLSSFTPAGGVRAMLPPLDAQELAQLQQAAQSVHEAATEAAASL
ncbi:lactate/malate family dehydrogenase [Kocuria arenosa]|uniref:lactate/malate family dehydrogenase n=1 Tax=Kocuria arenosa TaxID=3071446 RepID=UPI0034D49D8C